jgi:hypothetical protein
LDSHHSPEQIQAAFNAAPQVLRKLEQAGIAGPSFELCADASGKLILGREGTLTTEQIRLACDLIFSNRLRVCPRCVMRKPHASDYQHEIEILFCCGLVQAAGGSCNGQ